MENEELTDAQKFVILFGVAVLVAVIGTAGMALTGLECFIPLTAIGLCLALPFGIWGVMGLIFGE